MLSSKFKERSHPVRLIHYKQKYFENGVSPTLPHTAKRIVISLGPLVGNFQDAKKAILGMCHFCYVTLTQDVSGERWLNQKVNLRVKERRRPKDGFKGDRNM
jgi:hypothetical protein